MFCKFYNKIFFILIMFCIFVSEKKIMYGTFLVNQCWCLYCCPVSVSVEERKSLYVLLYLHSTWKVFTLFPGDNVCICIHGLCFFRCIFIIQNLLLWNVLCLPYIITFFWCCGSFSSVINTQILFTISDDFWASVICKNIHV